MSNWLMLILLILLQCLAGLGLVSLLRIWLKPAMLVSLWMLTGVAISSFIPFLLQLLYIPITAVSVFITLILACLLLNIRYKRSLEYVKKVYHQRSFEIRIYELPFLTVIIVLVLISIWRCYYWPPTPRDLTSGPEVIAEYATREKTMINSVFTVNLESTNNQFKPPFITCLQIIYKYAGFAFGQLWLSTIVISFLVFLYHAMSQSLHRLLAGLFVVAFLAIPEMYAYTFMALFDYSNAVYFFLASYFLFEYFKNQEKNYLALSGLLMGMATYVRSETLVLAGLLSLAIAWHALRKRLPWRRILLSLAVFIVPAAIVYFVSITIYINYYLPSTYDIGGMVKKDLFNINAVLDRLMKINKRLLFSGQGIIYYGYFVFLFLLVLLTDIVTLRRQRAAWNWLFAVLVVYFGLLLLGHAIPAIDIDHSTKRGFMKMFPLMLLYMANSGVLVWLSKKITAWEFYRKDVEVQRTE